MSDLSRLSLNTATAKHATLAECTSACAEAGLGWIGPWRDRIQGVSNDEAARIISEAGLKASTVCRGGFLTGTDADSLPGAIAENTRMMPIEMIDTTIANLNEMFAPAALSSTNTR